MDKIEQIVDEALKHNFFNLVFEDNKVLFKIDFDYFKGNFKKTEVLHWATKTSHPIYKFEYGNSVFVIWLEASNVMIDYLIENES